MSCSLLLHDNADRCVVLLHDNADRCVVLLHDNADRCSLLLHDNVMMYFGIIYKQELVGIRVFIASCVMGLTRVPF